MFIVSLFVCFAIYSLSFILQSKGNYIYGNRWNDRLELGVEPPHGEMETPTLAEERASGNDLPAATAET